MATGGGFDMSKEIVRSKAAIIAALDGTKVDRLEVDNNFRGTWKTADQNKAYAVLIPIIGGVRREDLALFSWDLLAENIPSYPKGDEVLFFTPADFLHSEARRLASLSGATYQSVYDGLVSAFAQGGKVKAIKYSARNKRGGTWQAALLGIDKA